MFKKFNEIRAQRKESGKKGFTLVELIVVLVILAILAALLIPALTGYINKAKQKQIIAETRQCVMAAQTLADELTGTLGVGEYPVEDALNKGTGGATDYSAVKTLAEVSGTIDKITINTTNGKIESLEYTNGKKCTYKATLGPGETEHYKVAE